MAAWRFLWGYRMSLAMLLKNFPFFCWLSWCFAIVTRFLFINYRQSLMFPLVHGLVLKWPQKLFCQTSSHCRNYLCSKKIILHSITIYSLWQLFLIFYLAFNYSSLLANSTLVEVFFFFFWVEALCPHPSNKFFWCKSIMIISFSFFQHSWKPSYTLVLSKET